MTTYPSSAGVNSCSLQMQILMRSKLSCEAESRDTYGISSGGINWGGLATSSDSSGTAAASTIDYAVRYRLDISGSRRNCLAEVIEKGVVFSLILTYSVS